MDQSGEMNKTQMPKHQNKYQKTESCNPYACKLKKIIGFSYEDGAYLALEARLEAARYMVEEKREQARDD